MMKPCRSFWWMKIGLSLFMICNWAQASTSATTDAPLLGGLGSAKPADDVVRDIAYSVRSDVTDRVQADNMALTQYTVISYKIQIVAGTIYFIKIRINDDPDTGYVHARVFHSLKGSDQLVGLETGHSALDPITFVQPFF